MTHTESASEPTNAQPNAPTSTPPIGAHRGPVVIGWLFVALLGAWLLWAATVVQVEYYDGYDAVCNARYYLGLSDEYFVHRAPLMGALLMPAEWYRHKQGLHPLDLSPHHLTTALLHLGYLAAVWWGLLRWQRVRCRGAGQASLEGEPVRGELSEGNDRGASRWPALLAFVAAAPSFVFFSYAPFISHDILAGAALLWMLLVVHRFAERPNHWRWLLLIAMGAAAALIKQTFGLIWFAVLVAVVLNAVTERWVGRAAPADGASGHHGDARGSSIRWLTVIWLAVGAAVSGAITWLVQAAVLGDAFPEVSFLARPMEQVKAKFGAYDDAGALFPGWLYLRNAGAFGWLTVALLLPGLVMAWRGGRLQRVGAIVFMVLLAAMHLLTLKEVRYLAYLSPLAAALMLPPLAWLMGERRRVAVSLPLCLALLGWDYAQRIPEALRLREPFYQQSELATLLEPIVVSDGDGSVGDDSPRAPTPRWGRPRAPLVLNFSSLSFTPADRLPLAGDRYHRVFHFALEHLHVLYGYDAKQLMPVPAGFDLRRIGAPPPGAAIVLSNGVMVNPPTWRAGKPTNLHELKQASGVAERIAITRSSAGVYLAGPATPGGEPERVSLITRQRGGRSGVWITAGTQPGSASGSGNANAGGPPAAGPAGLAFLARLRGILHPVLVHRGRSYKLAPLGDGYLVQGLAALPPLKPGEAMAMRGFRLLREHRYPIDVGGWDRRK